MQGGARAHTHNTIYQHHGCGRDSMVGTKHRLDAIIYNYDVPQSRDRVWLFAVSVCVHCSRYYIYIPSLIYRHDQFRFKKSYRPPQPPPPPYLYRFLVVVHNPFSTLSSSPIDHHPCVGTSTYVYLFLSIAAPPPPPQLFANPPDDY